MNKHKPPFRFDFRDLISQARRHINKRVKGVTISLPFVSFSVDPEDVERKAASEIVIRLADRRVLNAFECCDDCINKALASLQEIRSLLVDKQVQLSDLRDGSLYLVIEFMLEAIRQFFTFEEHLRVVGKNRDRPLFPGDARLRRPFDTREAYFAALEMLRAHIYRCMVQVAAIADIKIPKILAHMRYDAAWQVEAYVKPSLPAK